MNRLVRCLQVLWLVVIAVAITAGVMTFDKSRLQTDVRALLPQEERTQTASDVLTRISDNAARNLWVLVRAKDRDQTLELAQRVQKELVEAGLTVKDFDARALHQASSELLPYREHFVTDASRAWLTKADDRAILNRAIKTLYRPVLASPLTWENDPLGLFTERFQEVFFDRRFSVVGDFLSVADPKNPQRPWVFLQTEVKSALQLGETSVSRLLERIRKDAQTAFPESELLASGPVLISETVSEQASGESGMIGTVSAAALVVLIFVLLRSFAAVVEVLSILSVSFVVAFSGVWAAFGGIHIITMVFGMTLLGVAVDYVFHYLTELFASSSPARARSALAKGLTVSLATSVAGYAVMLFMPMPILKQMALFCILGLASAWLSVLLFLPSVTHVRPMPAVTSRFIQMLGSATRVRRPWVRVSVLAIAALIFATGVGKLTTTDELRLLTKLPDKLMAEQQRVAAILSPESPAQFFVVRGSNSDEVVAGVQKLSMELDVLRDQGVISGFRSGLGLLTTSREQVADYELVHRTNERARQLVEQKLSAQVKKSEDSTVEPLTASQWLTMSVAQPLSGLWINSNEAIVMLSGVTPKSLAALEAVEKKLTGAEFVNTTGEISQSLAVWRDLVVKVLAVALCLMAAVLFAVYRVKGFRMLVPAVFGIAMTVGLLGWLSVPFSLFTVLPMVLLLALGVDYAVLLYSRKTHQTSDLSVVLAALSTILSFGLLSFSHTPALHCFGLALCIGIACVWLITMVMRPTADERV